MDLKVYFNKIRETEIGLPADAVVVVSLQTADGGKAGALTEVSRRIAARLVVDGSARVAGKDEARKFREAQAEAKRQADQAAAASRVQVTVVPSAEWSEIKSGRAPKG